MAFKFACPICENELDANEAFVGFRVRCLKCAAVLEIKANENASLDNEAFCVIAVNDKNEDETKEELKPEKSLDFTEAEESIKLWSIEDTSVSRLRYKDEEIIFEDARETVKRVKDVRDGSELIVHKINKSDKKTARFFMSRVRQLASIYHPFLERPIFAGKEETGLFYTLRARPGETLKEKIEKEKTLFFPFFIKSARQISNALATLHLRYLVHGNIRLETVFYPEGGNLILTGLLNFAIPESGKTPYQAPELKGKNRENLFRNDLQQLGQVFKKMYHCLPEEDKATSIQEIIERFDTEDEANQYLDIWELIKDLNRTSKEDIFEKSLDRTLLENREGLREEFLEIEECYVNQEYKRIVSLCEKICLEENPAFEEYTNRSKETLALVQSMLREKEKESMVLENYMRRDFQAGQIRDAYAQSLMIPLAFSTGSLAECIREIKKVVRRLRRIHRRIKQKIKSKNNRGLEQLLEEYLRIDSDRSDVRKLLVLLQEDRMERRFSNFQTAMSGGRFKKARFHLLDIEKRKWIIPVPTAEIKAGMLEVEQRIKENENKKEVSLVLQKATDFFVQGKYKKAGEILRESVSLELLSANQKDRLEQLKLAIQAKKVQEFFFLLTGILFIVACALFIFLS